MSTLIVPNQTAADAIPIGRRIAEIMKVKGNYYTQVQMSARLKIGRETYRLMLKGERDLYTFELDKIAKDLKMSNERILQLDIIEDTRKLMHLLSSKENPRLALDMAKKLLEIAIGRTETCYALNRLGCALFDMKRYDEAHATWLKAYDLATELYEEVGETDLQHKVLGNLMITAIERKEFVWALELCDKVVEHSVGQPEVLSELYYTKARINEHFGDKEAAAECAVKCLEYVRMLNNDKMMGHAHSNVAHYAYKLKKYEMSKTHLEQALQCLKIDDINYCAVAKELIKTLIKLGESQKAEEFALSLLQEKWIRQTPNLEGKLYVLLSRAKSVPAHAEFVAQSQKYNQKIRYLACKFLYDYYRSAGDSKLFLRYYNLAEEFVETTSDVLDEGDM